MDVQDLISNLFISSFTWRDQPFQDEDMESFLRIPPIGGLDPPCERTVR